MPLSSVLWIDGSPASLRRHPPSAAGTIRCAVFPLIRCLPYESAFVPIEKLVFMERLLRRFRSLPISTRRTLGAAFLAYPTELNLLATMHASGRWACGT